MKKHIDMVGTPRRLPLLYLRYEPLNLASSTTV